MAELDLPLTGSCHCGYLRYEVRVAPVQAGWCHCSICRRTTGAPTLVWATVPAAGFAYVAGAPQVYRSSGWGERRFCPRCGAQIEYRRRDGNTVEINTGTLDRPELVVPEMHVWSDDALPWLHIADGLPRYPTDGPDQD